MKFQKFYILFCSVSWLLWLFSIVAFEILDYKVLGWDSALLLIVIMIPYMLSLTQIYLVFSIIALVGSIRRKEKRYIIFNVSSMIITLILGFLDFVYCSIFFAGV